MRRPRSTCTGRTGPLRLPGGPGPPRALCDPFHIGNPFGAAIIASMQASPLKQAAGADIRELSRQLGAFFLYLANASNRDFLPETSELDLSLTQLKALFLIGGSHGGAAVDEEPGRGAGPLFRGHQPRGRRALQARVDGPRRGPRGPQGEARQPHPQGAAHGRPADGDSARRRSSAWSRPSPPTSARSWPRPSSRSWRARRFAASCLAGSTR